MTIAEKLKTVAENEQKVYNAGRGAGAEMIAKRVNGTLTEIAAADLVGLTTIARNALSYLPLTSVTLPNSLTSLGRNCFTYCESLTSIVVPEGVTKIEYGALNGCAKLHDIVLPSTLESIEGYALNTGQRSSVVIRIHASTPPTIAADTLQADRLLRIVVPDGCGAAYKGATNWSVYADKILEEGEA